MMKRCLKLIHAADLHLDSPFEALGDKAALRRREQRQLLADIAALTKEKHADMLLLSGDLLNSTSAYAETGRALSEVFASLDCPVFIAPGNHDHFCAGSPYASIPFPEHVHIFREPGHVDLPELGARVYGAGFTDITSPPLLPFLRAESAETINLCVLHGELGKPDSRYNPISAEDIARSGMDYVALGHVHSHSGLLRFGDSVCAYPGCPEGRGFDECGQKGVLYLEVEKGAVRSEFIPVGKRRYMILEADLSRGEAETWLPADTRDHICRLILSGEQETAPPCGSSAAGIGPALFRPANRGPHNAAPEHLGSGGAGQPAGSVPAENAADV